MKARKGENEWFVRIRSCTSDRPSTHLGFLFIVEHTAASFSDLCLYAFLCPVRPAAKASNGTARAAA
jgi:hypothetical protein